MRSLAVAGSATGPARPPSSTIDEGHDRLVVGEQRPVPSIRVSPLAAGVDHRTQVGARTSHGIRHPGLAHGWVDRNHARRLRIGVDAEDVRAHLREQVGHDEVGGPVGQVEHELHLAPAPRQTERLDDVSRVELDRAGGKVDVADFAW